MKLELTLLLGAALCLQVAAQTPSDPFFGDWTGSVNINGAYKEVAVCMIPLGNNRYEARFFNEFGKQDNPLYMIVGEINDGKAKFLDHDALQFGKVKSSTKGGVILDTTLWTGTIKDTVLKGTIAGNTDGTWTLKKIERKSPTLGMKPIDGAVVLFDGTSTDAFKEHGNNNAVRWEIKDNAMEVKGGNIIPKKGFGDCVMHIEFRSPYTPDRFGQARGNSGVYVNGAYEVQVLDSYGLPGVDNECGGIYQISRPAVNACFPPSYWQTYDIDFTAPRFDADGKKTANARLTVHQNGIKIYDDLELPKATAGAINPSERDLVGFLLQDHGDKVQYRNIWVLEK